MDYFPQDHREYLKSELVRRIQRRPHYSLRAFARDLELSPSTLSDFLNNKLSISEERIRQLSKKIALKETHQEHWIDLIRMKFAKDKAHINLAKIRVKERLEKNGGKLSLHRFKTLTTWYYLCIYHLIQMNPKFQDPLACAKALGITTSEVKTAIQSLLEVGILEKEGSTLLTKEDFVLVGENTPSEHIRQFHSQYISRALDSVESQTMATRELSTCLMTVRKNDIEKIRKDIQDFADKMVSKYTQHSDADELYCLTTQLFSLTKKDQNEN